MCLKVYDRIDMPLLAGKRCYPLRDLLLLHWDQERRFYPRGPVIGKLL